MATKKKKKKQTKTPGVSTVEKNPAKRGKNGKFESHGKEPKAIEKARNMGRTVPGKSSPQVTNPHRQGTKAHDKWQRSFNYHLKRAYYKHSIRGGHSLNSAAAAAATGS